MKPRFGLVASFSSQDLPRFCLVAYLPVLGHFARLTSTWPRFSLVECQVIFISRLATTWRRFGLVVYWGHFYRRTCTTWSRRGIAMKASEYQRKVGRPHLMVLHRLPFGNQSRNFPHAGLGWKLWGWKESRK